MPNSAVLIVTNPTSCVTCTTRFSQDWQLPRACWRRDKCSTCCRRWKVTRN